MRVTDTVETLERVKALMIEGGLPPTPVNYDLCYRYVAATDAGFVKAVDTARREGKFNGRTATRLRATFFGQTEEDVLAELMDETKDQLDRIAEHVESSGGDARLYKQALDGSSRSLENGLDPDTHRALLTKMAAATQAMIDKTSQLEDQLVSSSKEILSLRRDLEKARSESRTDPLTGLPNRKAFNAYLEAQTARALADRKPLTLCFLDIDHFKNFNDRWGHALGDEVLRLVAQSMEHFFHGLGFAARYGGEEFVIVLPGKDLEAAGDIAEQFRDFIGSRTIRSKQRNEDVGKITLSLGVSQMRRDDSLESFIDRADTALYAAKQGGRNQVAIEAPATEVAA